MSLPIFQRTIVDSSGNIQPGASVAVRNETTGDLVTIYADREGGTAKANPFIADSEGFATFYVEPGEYQVTATTTAGTITWSHVAIGDTALLQLAQPAGDTLVGSDDDAGGSLWTTVAGFIDHVKSEDGASVVGYKQTGVGAVDKTLASKLRERYSLSDYYDPSEGAAAMHNALTRVCSEAPRQTVEIDIGDFDWTLNSDFVLPTSKRVLMHGHGSVNFAGGSIVRANHDKHTILHGFKGTGAFPIFKFNAAPATSAYKEYEITGIEAQMNSGVWALSFNGAREGIVENCYFRSGQGIYRTLSNISHVSKSFFLGLDFAVFDDGAGSGFSAGLHIADSEILGCKRSLVVSECDDGQLENCTVDYNDEGIYLLGQDRFKIFGGYIGTRTSEATTPNVAAGAIGNGLNIIGTAGSRSEKVTCIGVQFTGHDDGNLGYSNVYLQKADRVTIADCGLTFYTQNAVRYGSEVTYLNVHDCATSPKGGSPAVNVIECTSTDSDTNRFKDNVVGPGQLVSVTSAKISGNIGYATRNRGEAIAASGTSSVTFSHGLSYTPAKSDVILTPTNLEAALKNPYVSAVNSTQITVAFTSALAANAGVGWTVERPRF